MKTAIIAFEGVCVPDDRSKSLFERVPVPGSAELLRTLAEGYNLIAAWTVSAGSSSAAEVMHWLRQQNFPSMEMMYGPHDMVITVQQARRRGYDVSMVLSATPDEIAQCVKMGVQALLVVSPSYMRPEFRPDYDEPIRPWDEMVEQIDAVREQRNKDSRFEIVES